MSTLLAMFPAFVLGFVVAQFIYMRLLDRGHRREESYREMLANAHRRNRETWALLSEARNKQAR